MKIFPIAYLWSFLARREIRKNEQKKVAILYNLKEVNEHVVLPFKQNSS